jgi:hypothetical protein
MYPAWFMYAIYVFHINKDLMNGEEGSGTGFQFY